MSNVFERILESIEAHPNKIAVWSEEGSFTFRELYDYSMRVAEYLRKKGVVKGDVITIELPRCKEYLGFILGSWTLGAAFVPSDDSYPEDRKIFIAEDSGAKLRIGTDDLASVGNESFKGERANISMDDLAFIVYTSGSTGKPKGVVHNHWSIHAFTRRSEAMMDCQDDDKYANAAAFTFVVGVSMVIRLLEKGCPDYILPQEARVNLNKFADFLADHDITMAFMAPAMLPYFRQKKKALRHVFIGGERAVRVWSDDFNIYNCYGLSETCGMAMCFLLDKPYDKTPLGKPLWDINAYILDENGNEADEGEICLTGYLSTGYKNLPEVTAKSYVPNPFKEKDGFDIMFRTGDIGHRLPDGNIVFMERNDWMVNINGQRVEPGEIAAVMLTMPGVYKSVVKDFKGSDDQTFLCAYYVADKNVTDDGIRDYLKTKLPHYMVPAYLMRMDAMPLNYSGKVDRKALPDPTKAGSGSAVTAGPSNFEDNMVTKGIREILKDLTGRTDFRYDENLVYCGLSSLTAIKFTSEVMGRFGVDLDVTSMLGGCSIASISDEIIAQLVTNASKGPVSQKVIRDKYPLTKTQLGIYTLCYTNPESTMYNIPLRRAFAKAELEGKDLCQIITSVINAHPGLKCTIGTDEKGEACMVPHPDAEVIIERMSGSREELDSYRKSFVRPLDLSKSLYRIVVFDAGDAVEILMDFSHIMFDGTSSLILMQDFNDVLEGRKLEPEPYTVFDLADEEAERMSSPEYTQAEKYYSDLLSDTDGVTMIQRDNYGNAPTKGHLRFRIDLDPSKVRAYTDRIGATENAYFQSVMGYTMSRFTFGRESCHATVYNGRKGAKTNRLVGMMVKTLPVVFRFDSAESPEAVVKRTSEQLIGSMKNDLFPFSEIASKMGVTSDIMMAYQGILDSEKVLEDELEIPDIQNPLTIQIYPMKDRFLIDVLYDASMYTKELMESYIHSFERCAFQFLEAQTLMDIELTGEEDIALVKSTNSTDREYDRSLTAVDMFRRMASEYPDHIAVSFNGRTTTYSELDRLTDHIASYVHSKGIGRDRFVAVLVPRSDTMVKAALGVLKSGAAYQPLDPTYPRERLQFMMEDSGVELLIADRSLIDLVPAYKGEVLFTDEFEESFKGEAPDVKSLAPKPKDAIIILYTSGTTGKPKGCVLEHGNLTAFLAWYQRLVGITSDSHIATYASFGFDACMMDIYISICTGASLYVIPDEMRKDLEQLDRFYIDNGITQGFMTTQMGRMFMQSTKSNTLRTFTTGGETLVPLMPPENIRLLNLYGPTECTVCVTSYHVIDDNPLLPIGKPSDNTRLYVLDEERRMVPTGACGELCISGPQVFREYLNNPEKTAATLVANPYSEGPDYDRMYRTGDVVRMLPDGNIDFIGRRDGMVKVRGFRIELTEIEKVIRDFKGIRDATVQAFDAPAGGKFVAAYVVSDERIDIKALNDFILETKPPYMVPAITMQVDEIPLTVNSKVDKRKLPVPTMDFGTVTKPKTDVQKRIFKVVSEVIGTDAFGIETDFFQAGLTSIGSVRLNVLLSEEFGIPFQSKYIKDNSTVERLEKFIEGSAPSKTYEVRDDYPMTKSQEGIFVECMAKPGSTVYNIPMILKYDRSLDSARLKDAVVKAVNAHPFILTEIFMDPSGDIRLRRKGLKPFTADDIEEISLDDFETKKQDLVQPFTLLDSRLIRIKIVHSDNDYLFADMHHIICDGTSMNIFLDSISRAYNGEELEPESFSGFEESLKEAEIRETEALERSKKYYDDLLAGFDRDFLPKGDVYHPVPGTSGLLRMKGADGVAAKVDEYCRRAGITANALVCAAFGFNLAKYNGSSHSIYTTVYNGRNDSRTAYMMSMLVKTLPVLCNIQDESVSPLKLAEDTGKQLMDSMANDIYSFAEISRELEVRPDVLFVYQGDTFNFDSFCGKPSEMQDVHLSGEKEPILFQMRKFGDTYEYGVEYDGTRFTPDFIEFFTKSFDNAIWEFMTCSTLSEVCLTDERTMDVVKKMNDTESEFDRSLTVVDHFRRNAKEHPDSIAVVCKDQSMTYRELDRVSDHIAAYIHSKGIGTDQYVAVLVPRSIYMVVAAEGIIKSGAAYQPLDPTYPEERLIFMMQDSDVKLLIADRELRDLVPGYTGDVLFIDELEDLCKGDAPDVRALAPKPEDAMIILYTSGTTGTPKGCVLEHRNLASFLNWMIPEVGLDNTSRYACYASFGFDACMMDIHSSMCSGATLYIIPEEMRKDLAEIDKYFISNGMTHGFMTTQMGRMFMEFTQCKSLKAFMTGGEALVPLNPPDWVDFYNIYGPTECTVDVTTFKVKDNSQLLPIGIPNTNVKLYVVDKSERIVPVGSCGELCISGPQVFREYLNNPEKTAATVVPSPFSDGPEYTRLYKTGDVVRLLPDGNIDYIGRRDGMVKVRGFRIELSEVEGIIREYEGIKDATVKAFDDPAGGKSITAYVVSDSAVDYNALSDFIRKSKPPYMVPAHFIRLDAIPMTINGKVDKRKLPEPSAEPQRAGRESADPLEKQLCDIFANVLGLSKVYADDNFFEIGGTSISASKLVLNCMNAGFPVVYKNIFDNPTPEGLAKFIQTLKPAEGQAEHREVVDVTPLSANVEESLDSISSHSPRRVLLTGATGYLGSHVLHELLRRTAKEVICLIRSGKGQTSEERLKTVFMYYFGGMDGEDVLKNVTVVDSDITDPDLSSKLEGCKFDTIINCAAIVKHFAVDDSIAKVNVGGVENLIKVAKAFDATLVQISTESVAGESVNGSIPEDRKLKENELDIGQNLDNKYSNSKFMAEKVMIEEIPKGLKAKIIRVGNLMSRDSDGEFQINFNTNAFMKQMKSYVKLGFFPVTDMDTEVEFSPIDMVAKAAVILAGTPEQFTVFHVSNCHKVHMANVLKVMRDNDMPVEVVSQKVFQTRFMEALKDETKQEYVSGLISYLGNAGETRRFVATDDTYTIKALYRLGFSWPIISEDYIDKAFKALKTMRFFK